MSSYAKVQGRFRSGAATTPDKAGDSFGFLYSQFGFLSGTYDDHEEVDVRPMVLLRLSFPLLAVRPARRGGRDGAG